jgi:hypothetical protein
VGHPVTDQEAADELRAAGWHLFAPGELYLHHVDHEGVRMRVIPRALHDVLCTWRVATPQGTTSLWEAVWPGEQPIDPPRVMPPPRQNRAPRLLIFTARLLDTARPDGLKAWRLVTLPQLGDPGTQAGLPFGLSIIAGDGRRVLLRATATGPTVGAEPDEEPFPDYVIPEGVRTCLRAGAANAGR